GGGGRARQARRGGARAARSAGQRSVLPGPRGGGDGRPALRGRERRTPARPGPGERAQGRQPEVPPPLPARGGPAARVRAQTGGGDARGDGRALGRGQGRRNQDVERVTEPS